MPGIIKKGQGTPLPKVSEISGILEGFNKPTGPEMQEKSGIHKTLAFAPPAAAPATPGFAPAPNIPTDKETLDVIADWLKKSGIPDPSFEDVVGFLTKLTQTLSFPAMQDFLGQLKESFGADSGPDSSILQMKDIKSLTDSDIKGFVDHYNKVTKDKGKKFKQNTVHDIRHKGTNYDTERKNPPEGITQHAYGRELARGLHDKMRTSPNATKDLKGILRFLRRISKGKWNQGGYVE